MEKFSCTTSEIQVQPIENRIKTDCKIVLTNNQIEEVKQASIEEDEEWNEQEKLRGEQTNYENRKKFGL